MSTLCGNCQEPLPASPRSTEITHRLTAQCIPCTAKGSREVRTGLLIEAWDRFTALRVLPKVAHPLFFTFEARKGGSASLLLHPADVRSELKIEAELAEIREVGMQPVVLALFTPGLVPLYIIKGYGPTIQSGG